MILDGIKWNQMDRIFGQLDDNVGIFVLIVWSINGFCIISCNLSENLQIEMHKLEQKILLFRVVYLCQEREFCETAVVVQL